MKCRVASRIAPMQRFYLLWPHLVSPNWPYILWPRLFCIKTRGDLLWVAWPWWRAYEGRRALPPNSGAKPSALSSILHQALQPEMPRKAAAVGVSSHTPKAKFPGTGADRETLLRRRRRSRLLSWEVQTSRHGRTAIGHPGDRKALSGP